MALEIQASAPIPVVSEPASRGASPLTTWVGGGAAERELTAAFLKRNGAGNPSLCPDPCGERAGLARGKPAHHRGWCVATERELTAAFLKRNGAGNPSLCPDPCGERAGLARGKPAHHRGWGVATERELTAAFLKRNGAGNPSLCPIPVVSELVSRGASPLTTGVGVLPQNVS